MTSISDENLRNVTAEEKQIDAINTVLENLEISNVNDIGKSAVESQGINLYI